MNALRTGDWKPGGASPSLLAVQLVTTFQAALRGLDYWRHTGETPSALAVVESAAPPSVWAALMGGSAAVVLLGLAGRWAAVLILGHLMLASVYIGVGLPVLTHSAVGPLSAGVFALSAGALGVCALIHPSVRDAATRLVAVVLLVGVALLLSTVLGHDYRTGTGLVGAGLLHASLAWGVWTTSVRRRLTPIAEEVLA